MSGEDDEGFNQFVGYEGVLDPEAVDVRLRKSPGNEDTRLNQALRYIDDLSRELIAADLLSAALDECSYTEYAENLFALDIDLPSTRLRCAIARAWKEAWQFASLSAVFQQKEDDESTIASAARAIAQHHLTVSGLVGEADRKALDAFAAPYLQLMARFSKGAAPRADEQSAWIELESRRWDILADAGVEWSTDRECAAAEALLAVVDGRIVLNEEAELNYWGDDVVQRLRELVDAEPRSLGSVDLDVVDFFVLLLAEIYGFSLGEVVPLYFDSRDHRANGRDKRFAGFLEAAFLTCGVPISGWESRLRKWRKATGVVERLKTLSLVGKAVREGDAPPVLLDSHLHLASLKISSKLRTATG